MLELLFPNMSPSVAEIATNAVAIARCVLVILFLVANWKIFKKMGEKPWKALIPFYNLYLLFKNTWRTSKFFVYLSTGLVFDVSFGVSDLLAKKDPDDMLVTLLLLVAIPFGIISVVYKILSALRIAESFGKGRLFGLGLIFFYEIFMLALGFGNSSYLGNSEELGMRKSETSEQKEAE